MKKVAVVWSSPNDNGLTASAKDHFVKGLAEGGAEVTEIHLNRKKLEHCRACGNGWGSVLRHFLTGSADAMRHITTALRTRDVC